MLQGTKRLAPDIILILVFVFCWLGSEARADDFLNGLVHIYPRDWELKTEFDGSKRSSNGEVTTDLNYHESLRMRQNGYVLDPGIATFSIDQSFALEQGQNKPSDAQAVKRAAIFADYALNFSLLHGTVLPVNFSGSLSRNSGTINGGLGSRTEYINQNIDVNAIYKNLYFPSSVRFSQQIRDQTFASGISDRVSETDNTMRTLSYQGRSKKMQVGLDYDMFTDQASIDDRDFTEASANFSHLFRWGTGSQLRSRTAYQSRTGFIPHQRFNIDELVKIKHSSKLESAFNYRYSTLTQTTNTVTHFESAELTHKLYNNLTTRLNLTGTNETVDSSQENEYLGKVDMSYQKGVRWKGKLSSSAGIGYGWTEHLSSGDKFQISDENHVVPVNSILKLLQRFIDTGTIVVTNLAGTVFYTSGLDYNITSVSDDKIEVQVTGGGAIAVGQTVLIDYKYQPAPSMTYFQVPYNFRIGLDYGWISVFEQFSGTSFGMISGTDDTFLNDQFDSKTGLKLNWKRWDFEASASAQYGFAVAGDIKTNTIGFSQSLSYALLPDATVNTDAAQTFVASGGRLTEIFSAKVSGNWSPWKGLFIRPFLSGLWNMSDPYSGSSTGAINDKFITAGFSVRWRVRSIDVSLRYNHDNRFGTTTTTAEDRLRLSLSRKF